MDYLKSIILGIIQGITEFLPVSSSGHLELAEYYFQIDSGEDELLLAVLLHLATALSTLVVFRKDLRDIFFQAFQPSGKWERRYLMLIVISMIPAGLVGLGFDAQLDAIYSENVLLVAASLVLTGVLLLLADRDWTNVKSVNMKSSIAMGLAQAVAILPGVSRSGSTISTALMMGVDREKAARFSFLMVLPLILGKVLLDLVSGDINQTNLRPDMIVGFLTAFVVGVAACQLMIRFVKRSKLKYFAFYCFIVAGLVFISQLF